ncbi:hypothetical protein MLP_16840 [Microlunatus phosphovorus NM-1]|uniref:Uncharacterized protein n=1 Tax=Microlunatus phosphovorus (strain ATCC 700054 / DSM 10555 / JCM 9379 / NBRC 101784 / NCIMB 13414 / VKM Ac-1990 / NM-1) TaxID=1032480 RepID=F5XRK8_MICPN|nr:hypothetical protein MLP_16840 [Microlunatus phosphovorus NM-1]
MPNDQPPTKAAPVEATASGPVTTSLRVEKDVPPKAMLAFDGGGMRGAFTLGMLVFRRRWFPPARILSKYPGPPLAFRSVSEAAIGGSR